MTPLDAYKRACKATDRARAAELAALKLARESGVTLQELGKVRGYTRAGVAHILKRAPAA